MGDHTLRHTFWSHLAMAGQPVTAVPAAAPRNPRAIRHQTRLVVGVQRAPMTHTTTAIFSDLHIGAGRLDDCDPTLDALLVEFLDGLTSDSGALELVFNGDFLDFAQAPPTEGAELRASTTDGTPLCFMEAQSVAKFDEIRTAHPNIFAALRRFLARSESHRIVILPGNHDADFFWPAVQDQFLACFTAELQPRLTFHCEQVYRPQHSPGLWIEHGHQYDACNRFFVGDAPRWSAASPPIFADRTGARRLLECIGTRFMILFLNRIDRHYPFVDNVKPFGRFLKLFGWSALAPKYGPIPVMIAVWAMFNYLGRTVFTMPHDLLGIPGESNNSASQVVRALADRLPNSGKDLVLELRARRVPIDRALGMYANVEADAETLLDWISENLDLLDAIDAGPPHPSLLGGLPGTLSLKRGYEIDESLTLRDAAARIARDEPVHAIVMGHTHEPVDETLPGGARYINIGSWTRYLRPDNDHSAQTWDILLEGQDAHFPYRLQYARHDPTATPRLRPVTFKESNDVGRG